MNDWIKKTVVLHFPPNFGFPQMPCLEKCFSCPMSFTGHDWERYCILTKEKCAIHDSKPGKFDIGCPFRDSDVADYDKILDRRVERDFLKEKESREKK